MCNNKKIFIQLFCFLVLLVFSSKLAAQDDSTEVNVQQKGKYAFVLYAGGGGFTYMSSVGPASSGTGISSAIVRTHAVGTVRIMWHPDHLLRFGLETGYVNFYSYQLKNGNTTGNVHQEGIPIMAVWSMALTKRINVFAGIGYYYMTTNLDYNGKVNSSAFSLGVNASVNYIQPISPKLGIGAELKWIEASQTKDYGMAAEVMLVWKFFEW